MQINRRSHLIALAASAGLFGSKAVAETAKPDYIDTWSGTLDAGPVSLRLKLIIVSPAEARIISLDQGSAVITASQVNLSPDKLFIEFKSVFAQYEATLSDPDTLTGTFTQGGKPMPLVFKRGDLFTTSFKPEVLNQALVSQYRQKAGTPAIGAAYARKDGPVHIFVDGLRSADATVAVTTEDQWHLGSNTKSMTATLIGRLVDKGAVKWTTTVGEVLGPKVKGMNPAYAQVSFLHLLSHMSGLQPNIDMAALMSFTREELSDARADRLAYASLALQQKPAAGLAEKMIYANNGYIVAGAMIEAVTGKPWEKLITEDVFAPLGLGSAGFGPPGTPGKLDQPVGHAPGLLDPTKRRPLLPAKGALIDNPTALGPAGRVHMKLGDLITYLRVHGDQPASFLKPETFRTLHTPPFGGNYALGWVVAPNGQLWHNGSNTVWYAEMGIDPATGLVSAVCANDADQSSTMPAVNALLRSAKDAA